MKKSTAIWLIQNTSLTFKQIADFCGLHILEVNAIADNEVDSNIVAVDPVLMGQLSYDEIVRCQNDPEATLKMTEEMVAILSKSSIKKKKIAKYTPIAKRQDKPNAIMWLLKNCPEMSDKEIVKLIGTTKAMVESIKKRIYWNYINLTPQDPVILRLCSQEDMYTVYEEAKQRHRELQAILKNKKRVELPQ